MKSQINTTDLLSSFLNQLDTQFPLSTELRLELETNTRIIILKPHELILREGQVSSNVTAVLVGLLRSYYIDSSIDYTSRFTTEGEVVLSVNSFYNQKPGYEFIEAVEPTIIAQISNDLQQKLLQKYLEYNYIVRLFTEKYYATSEIHLYQLRKQSAEQKWKYFLHTYPHLIPRVSLKHIASFLGMRVETLSRVRALH